MRQEYSESEAEKDSECEAVNVRQEGRVNDSEREAGSKMHVRQARIQVAVPSQLPSQGSLMKTLLAPATWKEGTCCRLLVDPPAETWLSSGLY